METTKRKVNFIIAGVLYGIAMFIWSFFSLGMGHGTVVLFTIFSSPISIFFGKSEFGFYLALASIPVIWMHFGLLMAFIDNVVVRFIFLVSIVAHYIMMFFFFITLPDDWRESFWSDFFRYLNSIDGASTIIIGLAAYLFGQVVMWNRFIKSYTVDIE